MEQVGTIWVCTDCMLFHETGERQPLTIRVPFGLLREVDIASDFGEEWDDTTEEYVPLGHREFDSARCPACGTQLAGERFRYAVFAWERS